MENYTRWNLMKSQTLAKSVFELHPVSISIDKYGFRETTLPTETEIFAWEIRLHLDGACRQNEIWVEQLEKKIQHPIYNLGVSGLSTETGTHVIGGRVGEGRRMGLQDPPPSVDDL